MIDGLTERNMIETEIKYFPPTDEGTPALVMQITHLVNSYMFWVGVTEERAEDAPRAVLQGNVCCDWACAMPPISVSDQDNCAANIILISFATTRITFHLPGRRFSGHRHPTQRCLWHKDLVKALRVAIVCDQ